MEAEPARPLGQRVLSVEVNGRPLEPEGRYTLATNDFVSRGGDGYVMFQSAKKLIDALAGQYVSGQVIAYISKVGTIEPKLEGRIKLR
jgi:2',3'-cyclic-nucleotide 2'-phosphodiesterase (5'-nucleotidase family)